MKTAIFGDIHANLEALVAVLYDAEVQRCSDFVCTGDIVGYNANPQECLDIVRDMGCPVVLGNHDEEAARDTALEDFNPRAAHAMFWTREHLDTDSKRWLAALPFIHTTTEATYVHATLDSPEDWCYVLNRFDASASLSYQSTPLCFIGHTHQPKFYVSGETVTESIGEGFFEIEPDKKYLVNVGSVGLPRDGDLRACYAILDQSANTVTLRRVEFDRGITRAKAIDAGLGPK